jgi:hypothetical protein
MADPVVAIGVNCPPQTVTVAGPPVPAGDGEVHGAAAVTQPAAC